jgi:hypothetical protein
MSGGGEPAPGMLVKEARGKVKACMCRHTHIHKHTCTHTARQTDREADRQTESQTDKKRGRQTNIFTYARPLVSSTSALKGCAHPAQFLFITLLLAAHPTFAHLMVTHLTPYFVSPILLNHLVFIQRNIHDTIEFTLLNHSRNTGGEVFGSAGRARFRTRAQGAGVCQGRGLYQIITIS